MLFLNYKKDKNKVVVSVVIHGNVSDMEVEESAVASSSLVPAVVSVSLKVLIPINWLINPRIFM